MINFINEVIKPSLDSMVDAFGEGVKVPQAADLLLGTAVQESRLKYLRQINGPALGVYQVEPATLDDIYENYLKYRRQRLEYVESMISPRLSRERQLITNLAYATVIARIKYWRSPGMIPTTLEGQAEYWKEHYNTVEGKGTVEEYITNYKEHVR
jgi:hypothetical protein